MAQKPPTGNSSRSPETSENSESSPRSADDLARRDEDTPAAVKGSRATSRVAGGHAEIPPDAAAAAAAAADLRQGWISEAAESADPAAETPAQQPSPGPGGPKDSPEPTAEAFDQLGERIRQQVTSALGPCVDQFRSGLRDLTDEVRALKEWARNLADQFASLHEDFLKRERDDKPKIESLSNHVREVTQERDRYRQEAEQARKEREEQWALADDLNERLTQIQKKVTVEQVMGTYGVGGGVQHDTLVQKFEQLKQRIESLAQDYTEKRVAAGAISNGDRTARRRVLAEFKSLLIEFVLDRAPAAPDAATLVDSFLGLLEDRRDRRSLDRRSVNEVATLFLSVLQEMSKAQPRARPLLAHPGQTYDPSRHQAVRGWNDEGSLKIASMVFPGYEIESPHRVIIKADVTTVSA